MKIYDQILPVSELTKLQYDQMLHLMKANYENVDADKFHCDLRCKDGVLMLTNEHQVLCGFSTYKLINSQMEDQTIFAIFSGDTIVHKEYWGQFALFRSFSKLINHFLDSGKSPLYWYLITKGIRTYLMLPLYFNKFYPVFSDTTPPRMQQILNHLGALLYGNHFHEAEGIIRLDPPADFLKPDLAEIPNNKMANPHVQFFLERNPGFKHGDELCCITEIIPENFTPATNKFMKYK